MTIRHRDDAFRLLSLSIAIGHGTTFSILDLMNEAQWHHTIVTGDGPLVISGALSGALEALRRRGTTPADVLSCPDAPIGGAVTEEDMTVAAGWLATGLLTDADPTGEHSMVTATMGRHGWVNDPAHATSLVLAIAVTAGHAGNHDHE